MGDANLRKLVSCGEWYAITAAFLWGINYPIVKLILRSFPEGKFMLIRFIVSVILLVGYLQFKGEGLGISRRHYGRVLLLGVLGVGLYNILWTCGIQRTTAANAALLISTSPIFAAVYAASTKQEKINLSTWVGTMLAFGGIYLIISQTPGAEFNFSSMEFTGSILVLTGSFLFALYAVIAKPMLDYYSPAKLVTLAMMGGLPVITLYGLYQDAAITVWQDIDLLAWFGLSYIIIFGTIVAFAFWYIGIQRTSPVRATVFHFIVPVTSMVFGALLLGDPVTMGQIAGAVLVFLGLIVVKLKFLQDATKCDNNC
ncbi:MAG: transporter, Drug/Metabolite Exporter family [Sporomusa sp.]|nr:transporter, Drug/Metabolite Exporter family [Sporomusa sp.]